MCREEAGFVLPFFASVKNNLHFFKNKLINDSFWGKSIVTIPTSSDRSRFLTFLWVSRRRITKTSWQRLEKEKWTRWWVWSCSFWLWYFQLSAGLLHSLQLWGNSWGQISNCDLRLTLDHLFLCLCNDDYSDGSAEISFRKTENLAVGTSDNSISIRGDG